MNVGVHVHIRYDCARVNVGVHVHVHIRYDCARVNVGVHVHSYGNQQLAISATRGGQAAETHYRVFHHIPPSLPPLSVKVWLTATSMQADC